jgi:formylglycine-generating enzyme required for sulfatase activity/tRNA A-37 threonylcarbamoyl transferase component Bud32
MASHPSADDLRAFGLGKLDAAAAETVSHHLGHCPACSNAVVPSLALPPELRDHAQYEIIRELGRGGMGVVYLARHRLTKRQEVLKLVSARLLDEPGYTERFLREMESIAKLDHPNIVKAYGAFQAGKLLVLAMEYVDGETLAQMVRKDGPLPVATACLYAREVAQGLQHAFERGMIHRDIKPQNLMVGRDGKRRIVKILDFGLAKPASESEQSRGLTRTGSTLGTPHYMAPEQIEDAAKVDIRADLYSLGCTLYFLLSGSPPFEGNGDIKLFDAHRRSLPEPIQSIRNDVPGEVAGVVSKLLQKDPARRYQTPGELAKAVEPFFKGEVQPPTPPLKPVPEPDTYAQAVPIPPTPMEGKQTVDRAYPKPSQGLPRGLVRASAAAIVLLIFCTPVFIWLVHNPGPKGEGVAELGLEMVWIPPGSFLMGTPQAEIARLKQEVGGDWFDNEGPRHEVQITRGFYLGKYEVTQGQYAAVMGENPSHFSPDGDGNAAVAGMDTSRFPVEKVSWDQATQFCVSLTAKERQAGRLQANEAYRLPTEAEWEYACRGRQDRVHEAFHYGNALSTAQANFNGQLPFGGAAKGEYLQRTAIVGSYLPNGLGLYDMHGNVWEWCSDWYGETTYSRGKCADPRGPPGGSARVMRGGGWLYDAGSCRSGYRNRLAPVVRAGYLGFRLARSFVE